jgi:hypothetical protein
MNIMDLAALALGSTVVIAVFIAKTNLDKSRVRVKANRKK